MFERNSFIGKSRALIMRCKTWLFKRFPVEVKLVAIFAPKTQACRCSLFNSLNMKDNTSSYARVINLKPGASRVHVQKTTRKAVAHTDVTRWVPQELKMRRLGAGSRARQRNARCTIASGSARMSFANVCTCRCTVTWMYAHAAIFSNA